MANCFQTVDISVVLCLVIITYATVVVSRIVDTHLSHGVAGTVLLLPAASIAGGVHLLVPLAHVRQPVLRDRTRLLPMARRATPPTVTFRLVFGGTARTFTRLLLLLRTITRVMAILVTVVALDATVPISDSVNLHILCAVVAIDHTVGRGEAIHGSILGIPMVDKLALRGNLVHNNIP